MPVDARCWWALAAGGRTSGGRSLPVAVRYWCWCSLMVAAPFRSRFGIACTKPRSLMRLTELPSHTSSRDQPKPAEETFPLAYLISFGCYGAWLHGSEPWSVDREHNIPGGPFAPPNAARLSAVRKRMSQSPYRLNASQRPVVLEAIKEARVYKGWNILAIHVRTNHVHVVVSAQEKPEKVLNHFKSYASRALNTAGGDASRMRWARHGSTRYLWKPAHVRAAIEYVMRRQGKPLSSWESKETF